MFVSNAFLLETSIKFHILFSVQRQMALAGIVTALEYVSVHDQFAAPHKQTAIFASIN